MRKVLLITILFTLTVTIAGCKSIVEEVAFHPDNENVLPANKLPRGIEEFYVTTKDKVKIQGLYLPLTGSDKVLIYFHGNAGNIYHRISCLVKLQKYGRVSVVGAGYRGYGKSQGSPSEEGIYQDGETVYKYVTDKLGYKPENIIILGRSIGTTVAINSQISR